uniref:Uncharacterized protein n=1 Tax=Kalanchoe fedtschenkoi TaxID=63787 RepID=A0A7N0T6Z3_KALFE
MAAKKKSASKILMTAMQRDGFSSTDYAVKFQSSRADKAVLLDVKVWRLSNQSDLKEWLGEVRRVYCKNKKNGKRMVVAVSAKNGHQYSGNGDARKDMPLSMLQICIGRHCLIIDIDSAAITVPASLKAFFRDLFSDHHSFRFVGIGVEPMMAKLSRDYGRNGGYKDLLLVEPIDVMDMGRPYCEGFDCSLKTLFRIILGIDYVQPNSMMWLDEDEPFQRFSDDVVGWSATEIYLIAQLSLTLMI